MFLRNYSSPTIFIISSEKYLFIGRRPMPEYSMVNWLFDIMVESFRSIRQSDVLDAFNLLTVSYKLDTST